MQQKTNYIFRLAKKALSILIEKGPKALIEAYKERRRTQKSIVLNAQKPLKKKTYDTKVVKYRGRTLSREKLCQHLSALNQCVVLALSQDNYIDVNGGVQLTIGKEAQKFLFDKKSFLHIFPHWARTTLDFSDGAAWYGISLDGKLLGYIEENVLLEGLDQALSDKLDSIHIHHAMAFRLSFLDRILDYKKTGKGFFWIHDFFTLCPNYFLLRNNQEFCNAPPIESNACTICAYGNIRPKHLQGFMQLFDKHPMHMISPSQFAFDFWRDRFPNKGFSGEVRPHGQFLRMAPKHHRSSSDPIKVAYLGFPVFHKGWKTWLQLSHTFSSDPRYQFFAFSNVPIKSPNFKHVKVTVTSQNPKAMVDALLENQIDIAFLWSICPETFSYTLQEAVEAGAFVLTNPFSGNIQKQVKENDFGLVLEDEKALFTLFEAGLETKLKAKQA